MSKSNKKKAIELGAKLVNDRELIKVLQNSCAKSKENVNTDYSCGECGWWGWLEDCITDSNGEDVCPTCMSEQVGEVTEEDFYSYNALHGKLWYGKEVNENKPIS